MISLVAADLALRAMSWGREPERSGELPGAGPAAHRPDFQPVTAPHPELMKRHEMTWLARARGTVLDLSYHASADVRSGTP